MRPISAAAVRSPFDVPLLDSALLRSRLGCVAVVCLLYFGISLRVRNLEIPTGRSPDETNYTAQAVRLLREGGAGLRGIAAEYLADPAARLAGPPSRAGYLWALAVTMKLTGRVDETAGAWLSCAASVGSLLLVALIGIRFFPPWATVFALLFFAIFPAELELARRAWTDGLVELLGLAVVYSAMEITHATVQGRPRRFWYGVFVVAGCLGTVVKEFGAVTFALCALWVVGLLLWRGQRRDALLVVAAGLVGASLCLLWLAHGVGGLDALLEIIRDWRGAHLANQYAIEFQSGPPSLLLRAIYTMSPGVGVCLVVLLLISLYKLLKINKLDRGELSALAAPDTSLAAFASGYLLIPMLLPNWLNLRYVSLLFGPLCLLAGWTLAQLLDAARQLPRPARLAAGGVLAALMLIAAVSDIRRFPKFFVNDGVGDLSVKLILDRAAMFDAERVAKRSPTAEHFLDLCWRYEQNWRYKDSIAACENALKLRPEYAAAYDQMAVAQVDLEQWAQAAAAARRALELDGSLPRAKFNLERAQRELAAKSKGLKP